MPQAKACTLQNLTCLEKKTKTIKNRSKKCSPPWAFFHVWFNLWNLMPHHTWPFLYSKN